MHSIQTNLRSTKLITKSCSANTCTNVRQIWTICMVTMLQVQLDKQLVTESFYFVYDRLVNFTNAY